MRGRRAFVHIFCRAAAAVLLVSPLSAGAQEAPLVVGQSAVLSGPQAANGLLYNRGIRLHLDAVNAAGGIGGRKLEMISLDDGYDPERTKANTRQILDDKRVVALFGYTGTGSTMASAALAEAAKVPMLAPLTGAPELRDKAGRYLFHVRASYVDELRKAVEYLSTIGIRDIAIAYQDDGFGRSGLKSAETVLDARGLKPVGVGAITGTTYDSVKAAADIAARAPSAILLATAGQASVNFIREYQKTGARAQFFGLSVVSSSQLLQELGADADGVVISQVVPSPWTKTVPLVREFLRAAEAAKDVEVNHTTLEGYIAARVLVEALRRAGPEVTPERVTQALEGMRPFGVGGYDVSFAPGRRDGSSFVDLSLVRADGRYIQ